MRNTIPLGLIVAALLLWAPFGDLGAQRLATEREPLIRRSELLGAVALAAITVALLPADQAIAEGFHTHRVQDSLAGRKGYRGITDALANINEFRLFYASAATWGIGRITGQRRIADIGWHAAEAIFVSRVITDLAAGPAGRARPRVNMDSRDFKFWRGFTKVGYHAFPSRHAAGAFAFASAVTLETKRSWPHATKWVAPSAYALATVISVGRMYTDHHWLTDAVVGAGVGMFAGMKTVNYSHTHPNNSIDRIMLGRHRGPDGEMRTTIGIRREF